MDQVYDGIVVGAGLSGLMLFEHLSRAQSGNYILLEKESATYIMNRTHFPETHNQFFLSTDTELISELKRLNLGDQIVEVKPSEAIPLIYSEGHAKKFPTTMEEVRKSPLLGMQSFIALVASTLCRYKKIHFEKPFYEAIKEVSDENWARLFSEAMIPPFFGEDGSKLEILSAFPAIQRAMKKSTTFLEVFKTCTDILNGKSNIKILNLTGGYTPLVEHFLNQYPYAIHYDEHATKIESVGSFYRVYTNDTVYMTKNVYSCLNAPHAAELFKEFDTEIYDILKDLFYSSLYEVELTYNKDALRASTEASFINLGYWTHHVSKYMVTRLTDDGKRAIRVYLNPNENNIAHMTDDEIFDLVIEDVKKPLKVTQMPLYAQLKKYPNFSPLYQVGHGDLINALLKKLESHPGVYVVGNFVKGILFNEVLSFIKTIPAMEIPKIVREDPYLQPQTGDVIARMNRIEAREIEILENAKLSSLSEFARGSEYFGYHIENGRVFVREWAPNATDIYLICDQNEWKKHDRFRFHRLDFGNWELELNVDDLKHGDNYKLIVCFPGGEGERIPSYANYVVQDPVTHVWCTQVYCPKTKYVFKNESPKCKCAPIIYEAHVGMSAEEGRVNTYRDFADNVLPRIKDDGYNTVQLMAIGEHPYYGSFGYQVSNFFAPASRSGNPDDLKYLIDKAHGLGLRVVMDIVHSHAVKNEAEGLGRFDGTQYQYFHDGGRGLHPAWDTYLFNYGKTEVIHFLLSNIKYWLTEFKFDGFRFDGVTSMLYLHHGLGFAFCSYADYFGSCVDHDAVTYLGLANKLIKEINPYAISIAEDMSGLPGIAAPLEDGGVGFDYRLSMGIPDFWIKMLKDKSDDQWNMHEIYGTLMNCRYREGSISYVESHDQALVGDKTSIFWLIDKDMYTNMRLDLRNLTVDRGLALHKMMRAITFITAKDGYLNFMGNEFGHPEWIDFPREGNGWSYHYARRQWSLADDDNLCYKFLGAFDKEMIKVGKEHNLLKSGTAQEFWIHDDDHVIALKRGDLLFFFNFHPTKSFSDYGFNVPSGEYEIVYTSDESRFGGFANLPERGFKYHTVNRVEGDNTVSKLELYLPSRTMMCLKCTRKHRGLGINMKLFEDFVAGLKSLKH